MEVSLYDEAGSQNGPAKITWPTGAAREGTKVDGKWHGQAFYTFADGPREGRGQRVSSQQLIFGMSWMGSVKLVSNVVIFTVHSSEK